LENGIQGPQIGVITLCRFSEQQHNSMPDKAQSFKVREAMSKINPKIPEPPEEEDLPMEELEEEDLEGEAIEVNSLDIEALEAAHKKKKRKKPQLKTILKSIQVSTVDAFQAGVLHFLAHSCI
jgi:hypothetical protein